MLLTSKLIASSRVIVFCERNRRTYERNNPLDEDQAEAGSPAQGFFVINYVAGIIRQGWKWRRRENCFVWNVVLNLKWQRNAFEVTRRAWMPKASWRKEKSPMKWWKYSWMTLNLRGKISSFVVFGNGIN